MLKQALQCKIPNKRRLSLEREPEEDASDRERLLEVRQRVSGTVSGRAIALKVLTSWRYTTISVRPNKWSGK